MGESVQVATASPSSMGFNTEKFVSKVSDDRKCALCNLVLDNPVQAPCSHVFCSGCVLPWVVTHGCCPFGCQALNTGDLNNVLALRDLVLNMKVICEFKPNGCECEPQLREFVNHTKYCEWRPTQCKNVGCDVKLPVKELGEHETSECDFRPVGVCNAGCEAILFKNTAAKHNCVDYLKSKVAEHEKLVHDLDEEINQLKSKFTSREKELRVKITCLQKMLQMQGIKLVNHLRNYESQHKTKLNDNQDCSVKVCTVLSSSFLRLGSAWVAKPNVMFSVSQTIHDQQRNTFLVHIHMYHITPHSNTSFEIDTDFCLVTALGILCPFL